MEGGEQAREMPQTVVGETESGWVIGEETDGFSRKLDECKRKRAEAASLSRQGQEYLSLNKLQDALAMHEQAKRLRVEGSGKGSLHVAASLRDMHKVLRAQGKAAEAKEALEEALLIQRRHLGKSHTDVVATEEELRADETVAGADTVAELLK